MVLAWSIWHRMAGSCWPSQDLAVRMAKLSACDADMIVIQMLYRLTQTLAERWKASRRFSLLGVPPCSPNKHCKYMTIIYNLLVSGLGSPSATGWTHWDGDGERDIYYIFYYMIIHLIYLHISFDCLLLFGMEVDVAISAAVSASWRGSHRP